MHGRRSHSQNGAQTSAAHYDKYSLYKNSDCTPRFSDAVNYHSLHPDAVCTAIQTV